MHRSSESVAALASALAKAQAELVNPEKSLSAAIRTGRPGEGERSFRYAPLASGLEIVRKMFGQHKIATIQSTAIDKDAASLSKWFESKCIPRSEQKATRVVHPRPTGMKLISPIRSTTSSAQTGRR